MEAELERWRRENAGQAAEIAALRKRVAELEARRQKFLQRGKPAAAPGGRARRTGPDRRTKKHCTHPGSFRPDPPPDAVFIEHAVVPASCGHCGGRDLEPTGEVFEHVVAEIAEPKVEWHRFRHAVHLCRDCGQESQGRGDLELPGSHIGPRARLLAGYCRAHRGISLGKTQDLLHDFLGLGVSRAGRLGPIKWGGLLFAPVVEKLFALLRKSPVVGGDETGWRIDDRLAWAGCFRDPKLALFLIDRHRSRAVLEKALGQSFAGTLVSDFYAAYNRLACRKQRCLVHRLRERDTLREALPHATVRTFIQPLIVLFQDALLLGKERVRLAPATFGRRHQAILDRVDDLLLGMRSNNRHALRIWKRLFKPSGELFTFLDDAAVPPDNNGSERDVRSLTAARADGGTHRKAWSADAFARLKSVVATGRKNGVRFIECGIGVVRAKPAGLELPLPLAPDTG